MTKTPMTLRQLKAAAAKVGVRFEKSGKDSYGAVVCDLIAPKGKIFGEISSHFVTWEEYPAIDKEDGKIQDYSDVATDLDTLIDCDHDGCGCHDEEEAA